jgi:hypothetical protein
LEQLNSFFTKEELIDVILIEASKIHKNIYNLLIAIKTNQVQIEKSFQSACPMLIEANNELLQTHFLLLQAYNFANID